MTIPPLIQSGRDRTESRLREVNNECYLCSARIGVVATPICEKKASNSSARGAAGFFIDTMLVSGLSQRPLISVEDRSPMIVASGGSRGRIASNGIRWGMT